MQWQKVTQRKNCQRSERFQLRIAGRAISNMKEQHINFLGKLFDKILDNTSITPQILANELQNIAEQGRMARLVGMASQGAWMK